MSPRTRRLSKGLQGLSLRVLTAVALLSAPAPVSADFRDNYRQGVKAAEAGNWKMVRSQMTTAVKEQPNASLRLPKRLYFRRYIPHYYLGRAHFELGDCASALAAWKISEEQGIVQNFPEHAELAGFQATCRERTAVLVGKVSQAEGVLRRAEEAADLLADLPTPEMSSFWDEGPDSLALRAAQAQELLDEARQAFADRGEPADPAALETVEDLAREARESFESVEKAARLQLQEAVAERDYLAESLEPLRRRAQRALAGVAFLKPYPSGLAESVSRLEALLAASEDLGPATTAADLELLQSRLNETLRRVGRQAQAPPKALMTAAEAFFSGRYEDVLAELEDVELSSREAKAHGHLFLAAARFALYVRAGERNPALLAAAREDVLASRAVNGGRPPEPSAFSPRFIEFFLAQEGGGESEEAVAGEPSGDS